MCALRQLYRLLKGWPACELCGYRDSTYCCVEGKGVDRVLCFDCLHIWFDVRPSFGDPV